MLLETKMDFWGYFCKHRTIHRFWHVFLFWEPVAGIDGSGIYCHVKNFEGGRIFCSSKADGRLLKALEHARRHRRC